MCLSAIYFAKTYPDDTVYSFEPDQKIFSNIKENVENFGVTNIKLFKVEYGLKRISCCFTQIIACVEK